MISFQKIKQFFQRWKKTHLFLAFGGLLVFLILSGSIVASTQPGLCGACHQTSRETKEWSESSHQKIGCLSCHRKPGALGYLSTLSEGMANFSAWITKSKAKPRAVVNNIACRKCHRDVESKLLQSEEGEINHQHYLKKGLNCTDCHSTVAHRSVPKPRQASIDFCLPCHNGDKAPSLRRVFAADRKVWQLGESQGSSWGLLHQQSRKGLHGMGSPESCAGCHTEDFCNRCHKTQLPHESDFPAFHSEEANKKDPDCLTCHKKDFCVDCHKVEMPHPDDWLKGHSVSQISRKENVCLRCHFSLDCRECHQSHIHPGTTTKKSQGGGQ